MLTGLRGPLKKVHFYGNILVSVTLVVKLTHFMTPNFQSFAAAAIVVATAAVFLYRVLRVKKTGCGGACGCSQKLKNDKVVKSLGGL